VLLFVKRRKGDTSRDSDRSTLRFLWLVITICMTAGIFLGVTGRVGRLDSLAPFCTAAGVLLLAGGVLLRWSAILTLKRFFTVDVSIRQDHTLIRHGPYRTIRHPAYTGVLMAFASVGMIYANIVTFFLVLLPIGFAFLRRIRTEEAALLEAFGEEYREYSNRTWRLVPFLY